MWYDYCEVYIAYKESICTFKYNRVLTNLVHISVIIRQRIKRHIHAIQHLRNLSLDFF